MTVVVRPLEPDEIPPHVPYVPGIRSYGGGCEHRHQSDFPCGNSGRYLVGDRKLCWSHAAQAIRALMFKRVPIHVKEAS